MTLILAPQSGATPVAYHTVVAPTPIPFRKTAIVSSSEVFGMLITTLLVLMAIAALAWFARRQGWLERWTAGAPSARTSTLTVLEVRRISRKTTLYRVSNGGKEFLLAESSMQIQIATAQIEMERAS
jgi:hypothetical protein